MKRTTKEQETMNRQELVQLGADDLAAVAGATCDRRRRSSLYSPGGPVTMFSGTTPTFSGSYVDYGYPYGYGASGWGNPWLTR